ncbi:MAG TPA: RNA polymerase sigma factor, partial [Isosphaeraceae bacterium]|nr:RNA polymerase sigma factor [Isosphaeraceae bacterium]
MEQGQHDSASRHVRTLFNMGTVGGLTDGQLLERFTGRGAEAAELAFTALVERHGPMVLRVCRSVLRDPHDAHDAFQATFLVLMRRAGSLWVRDSLGPWLHQVAYRVASCARASIARRRRHEWKAAELAHSVVREQAADDLGEVLHEEVNRLPQGYRAAVVLCCFEGLSAAQAAQQLGWPVGTVQSRLARGREQLRTRLTRRGLAPALGALGAALAADPAQASMPAALVASTAKAAMAFASGKQAVTGVVSKSVSDLAMKVLTAMLLTKIRIVAATLIAIAALSTGAWSYLQTASASQTQPNQDPIRVAKASQAASAPDNRQPGPDGPIPKSLPWAEVAPGERLRILELLASQSKQNYERIKTWKGTYSYILRQYLDERFVAQAFAGQIAPPGKAGALMQELRSTMKFAIDINKQAIFRDIETSKMRFLKAGTEEWVSVRNLAPPDHRSIVTPEYYLTFHPNDFATTAFLPDHPNAQNKRRVDWFPAREAQLREGGTPDPRTFYKFDPGNFFWTGPQLYAV